MEHWLSLSRQPSELFNVVIQSGAVLAVLVAFAGRLQEMALNWRSTLVRDYVLKLAVAFLVTAAGGLALKKLGLRLPTSPAPVAWATLVGGIVILLAEAWRRERKDEGEITWLIAIGVASIVFFQVFVNIGMNLSILPVTGLTLPFVSYGGSGLTSLMLGIGLVQSVAMRHRQLEF
jgi:cell division protein FtsW (lipid II flippase)